MHDTRLSDKYPLANPSRLQTLAIISVCTTNTNTERQCRRQVIKATHHRGIHRFYGGTRFGGNKLAHAGPLCLSVRQMVSFDFRDQCSVWYAAAAPFPCLLASALVLVGICLRECERIYSQRVLICSGQKTKTKSYHKCITRWKETSGCNYVVIDKYEVTNW